MNKTLFGFLILAGFVFLFQSCLPDRSPTEPVEIERPEFRSFVKLGQSNLNVQLTDPIILVFNERMDINTFPENVTISSVSGNMQGTFSIHSSIDTAVVFTPSGSYHPAEYYEISVSGKVRDSNGNSLLSPTEEDVPIKSWFFTGGNYSENGFPLVFIRDKSSKQVIYRVGDIIEYRDSLYLQAPEEDYQTAALEFSPYGEDYLYMVNLKITDGTVTVIDPSSFTPVKVINVGLGPTNIGFSEQKGYVTNNSGKSFTVIDIVSLEPLTTYEFADGFKPKDVVYSSVTNKLYFYSSNSTDLKVVNAENFDDSYLLASGILENKPVDMEITPDGKFIYIVESRNSRLVILDVTNDNIAKIIETGYDYNIDGVMGNQYFYLSFYRRIDREDVGGISKIEISSHTVSDVLLWPREVDQITLTAENELIYAVSPNDSTLQLVETKTLKNIGSTKINGSLKYTAVSRKNY